MAQQTLGESQVLNYAIFSENECYAKLARCNSMSPF